MSSVVTRFITVNLAVYFVRSEHRQNVIHSTLVYRYVFDDLFIGYYEHWDTVSRTKYVYIVVIIVAPPISNNDG